MTKIMIIEDDIAMAELYHRYLNQLTDFDVVAIATTYHEAQLQLELLQPDLILLDIYLPDGHGIDILQQIRLRQLATDVILITADREVETLRQAMHGGVVDYLLKPVIFPRLEAALIKYQQQQTKFDKMATLDQGVVDKMLSSPLENASVRVLPKGIDGVTLNKIQALYQHNQSKQYTADIAGEKVGVSRTTARRYLEYLTATGELVADLHYGAVGRPERCYTKAKR